jgi:tetratricopeptide (TPR) repeat protein
MDVGSRSGTRVNGKVIDKPTQLKDGDKIQLGEVTLEIDWKGVPKAAEEKATIPYFRPEPVTPAKAEWWKWAVGIAAGIIIIVAAVLLLPKFMQRDPLDRLSVSTLIDNAQTHHDDGIAKSDTVILNTALHEITVALKKEKTNARADKLKTSIVNALQDIKVAFEYYESALKEIQKGDLEQAIVYLTNALEKDPQNQDVINKTIETRKALAYTYENEADKIRNSDRRGSNELYDKAIAHWKAVQQLNQTDTEPIKKIVELINKKKGIIIEPIHPPIPKTDPEIAQDLYYSGKLTEARAKAEKLPENYRMQALLINIGQWEEANYNLERLNDTTAAITKYDELYKRDPNNTIVRDILRELRGIDVAGWPHDQAQKLYNDAESPYHMWLNYKYEEDAGKAEKLYQQIVNMGPPTPSDQELFNTTKARLEELRLRKKP